MAEATVTPFAAATAVAVYGDKPPCINAKGAPVVVPRDRTPSSTGTEYLSNLTRRAGAAASSIACGSILAGSTSESDEYGDVAFWLGEGDFGPGHEQDILDALDLRARLTPESKVQDVPLSPSTHLPASLGATSTGEIASLTEALSQLRSPHCFRVEGLAGDDSIVVYILLGQLTAPNVPSPWVGLMGVAVWS